MENTAQPRRMLPCNHCFEETGGKKKGREGRAEGGAREEGRKEETNASIAISKRPKVKKVRIMRRRP